MSTTLDHLYGAGQTAQNVAALETKVNNLSQITVKNNISNQVIPQQKINTSPTDGQHIVRLGDLQYERIVNQTSAVNANQVLQWSLGDDKLINQRLHSFIIKCAVSGVDYLFNCSGWIENKTYKNMFPTFSFASGDNLNETAKIKFWIHDNKVKMFSSVGLASVSVYRYVEKHR